MTRAMRRVSVPVEFFHAVQPLDRAIAIADGHVPHSECTDPADGLFFLLPRSSGGGRKYTHENVVRIAALGRTARHPREVPNGYAPIKIIDVDPIEEEHGVTSEPSEPRAGAARKRQR